MGDNARPTRRVYLDHAATTPLLPAARAALLDTLDLVGNPHAVHTAGRRARAVVDEARELLADALDAHPMEVVFTAGGTEADNLAVLGAAGREGRPRILTSAIEHPAVARAFEHVRGDAAATDILPVTPGGHVDPAAVAATAGPDTALVTVQWVNNEVGTVQPIGAIASAAAAVGAWSHSDAAQAVGHVPVSFAASGLDMLTVAAHKVGGPVGIGALLVSRDIAPAPSSFGGGQERSLRSGTLSAPLAAAFAAAVAHAVRGLDAESARLTALRTALASGILTSVPGTRVNGTDPVSPGVCSVTFTGLRASDLQFLLDREGFDCSTGSACHAGVVQPSDVLLAMGRSRADASATLRFSLGWTTAPDDVTALLRALPTLVERARDAA
ncbi:cysteine desulfurase family protein [Propionicicella superfundia]|uniref:cysteine desulfurase family protein n=1 Tax=Propionicicella superfundia TaxID=348582 RepID=UPI0004241467|nr:cysteine desulfurase family protein [Propionicicella superfundia]